MSGEPERPQPGYRLGGREKRGLLAGWRAGQVAAVALALAVAVVLLRLASGALGVSLALAAVVGGLAVACWPVRGRGADEWVPALARHGLRRALGRLRSVSSAPWQGLEVHLPAPAEPGERTASAGTGGSWRTASILRSHGPFSGLSVEDPADIGLTGERLGLVRDRRAGTVAGVVAVSGEGFALLGREGRRDRVNAWAQVLATLARDGTQLHRLQWVERCVPDDLASALGHLESARRRLPGEPGEGAEVASYRRLLDVSGAGGWRHELYLVVCVREQQGLRVRRAGAAEDLRLAAERLRREVDSLERALRQAELHVDGALDPGRLRRLLAEELGVGGAGVADGASGAGGEPGGTGWPVGCETGWSSFRTDAAWHATSWIAEWPRVEVGPEFLLALLTGVGVRRTLSMTMAPVTALDASRAAERARVSGVADAALREKHGFAVTARAVRDQAAVAMREAELAEGHASYRFSAYVTVTAGDPGELEVAHEAVARAAALSQLELRRLYGAQDEGRLATLPLARGLS